MNEGKDKMSDRELDGLLDALSPVEPSAALRRAVAEIPLRHPRTAGAFVPWPLRSLWTAVLSATFVALLGVATGFATAEASVAEEEDWTELQSLAFAAEVDAALEEAIDPKVGTVDPALGGGAR